MTPKERQSSNPRGTLRLGRRTPSLRVTVGSRVSFLDPRDAVNTPSPLFSPAIYCGRRGTAPSRGVPAGWPRSTDAMSPCDVSVSLCLCGSILRWCDVFAHFASLRFSSAMARRRHTQNATTKKQNPMIKSPKASLRIAGRSFMAISDALNMTLSPCRGCPAVGGSSERRLGGGEGRDSVGCLSGSEACVFVEFEPG